MLEQHCILLTKQLCMLYLHPHICRLVAKIFKVLLAVISGYFPGKKKNVDNNKSRRQTTWKSFVRAYAMNFHLIRASRPHPILRPLILLMVRQTCENKKRKEKCYIDWAKKAGE